MAVNNEDAMEGLFELISRKPSLMKNEKQVLISFLNLLDSCKVGLLSSLNSNKFIPRKILENSIKHHMDLSPPELTLLSSLVVKYLAPHQQNQVPFEILYNYLMKERKLISLLRLPAFEGKNGYSQHYYSFHNQINFNKYKVAQEFLIKIDTKEAHYSNLSQKFYCLNSGQIFESNFKAKKFNFEEFMVSDLHQKEAIFSFNILDIFGREYIVIFTNKRRALIYKIKKSYQLLFSHQFGSKAIKSIYSHELRSLLIANQEGDLFLFEVDLKNKRSIFGPPKQIKTKTFPLDCSLIPDPSILLLCNGKQHIYMVDLKTQ